MSALPFTVGRYGRDTHTPEGQSKSGYTPEGHPHDTDTLAEGVTHPVHPSGSVHDARPSEAPRSVVASGVLATTAKTPGPATTPMLTQGEIARVQGFTGDTCTGCGGFSMRRNGTCLLCVDCGGTTGCS